MTMEISWLEKTTEPNKLNAPQPGQNLLGYADLGAKNYVTPKTENLAYQNYAALKALTLLLIREIEEAQKSVPGGYDFSLRKRISLQDEVHRFEANLIRNALIHVKGSQTRAARILGVRISTLHEKMKRYEIDAWDLKKLGSKRA